MDAEKTLAVVILTLLVLVVGMGSAAVGRFLERRKWERRLLDLSSALRRDRPDADAGRMRRLEEAVDAIAVELERVGEGQRFVTRVLAGRGPKGTQTPQPGASLSSPPSPDLR